MWALVYSILYNTVQTTTQKLDAPSSRLGGNMAESLMGGGSELKHAFTQQIVDISERADR